MTKRHVNRTLRTVFWSLGLILAVAFAAKMTPHLPGLRGTPVEPVAADLYAYLREMAPVFITVVAVYLASVFRKRSNFIESLEEEWRNIVRTKSALYAYFDKPYPATDDYIAVWARLSETLDTMRIVYRNVGETKSLVGLYPYAPLHDMRRVLQAMDPRLKSSPSAADRKLAQDSILQSFAALRENFLEELDLDEPHHPLLISAGRRRKASGFSPRAAAIKARQRLTQNKSAAPNPEIDAYLGRLYAAETPASPAVVPMKPAAQTSTR